jgi:hypothetical protein
MSNLLSHAKDELDRIGMTEDSPDEMNRMMRKHVLHMMQEFANEGHSGFSASYAISILTKLMDFKPITPLTGADDEWNNVGYSHDEDYWQNKRCSSVFKNADGTCYDIDGRVFWEWAGTKEEPYKSYYSGGGSATPVTFPYTVPDKPIYEYRYSDAEPPQPAQNESGFL